MQSRSFTLLMLLFFVSSTWAQTPVIDSLQKIIAQGGSDSLEAAIDIKLADEFARSDIAEAKRYSLRALSLARQLNEMLPVSAAYSQMVTLHAQTNQPDSAWYYLGLLKGLALQSSMVRVRANYHMTAGLFYHRQGNYKASLPYMLEALRLTMLDGTKTSQAGQNLNIGNCYMDMGDYKSAIAYHLKALKLFEIVGNKRGISFCYSAIGGDFIKLKQFAEALPYTQQSLELKNELNDKKGRATCYMDLGAIQEGLGQDDKALASYMEALSLNREIKVTIEEARGYLSIGELYARKKDPANAREYLKRSSDLFRQSGDTAFLAMANAEMANLQSNLSREEATEKAFLTSLATSINMGDKPGEINSYKYLADFYARNKQYDKALGYSEKYHQQADSLQSQELQLEVKQLEQQYQVEKQEKEISLLKKDKLLYEVNTQEQKLFRYGALIFLLLLLLSGWLVMARYRVVQKSKRLLEIEKIRNNIARNLHDDIGSTLTSINILSKVALQQEGGNIKVTRDLEKIKDRSSTIMESMGDIVWAINPANDPLDKTILKMKEFAAEILDAAGIGFRFTEDSKLADLKLGVEERKNVYLIFKEAINNSVKYSGADFIDIVLQKNARQFLLVISDNGKGFDTGRQYSGNGLKNMQSRAAAMNARLEIHSRPAEGTRISVAIPLAL
ncbi:MAG TPA: tetratricopeptide repeat protein [Chitinophagaceae bacterium]